MAIQKAMSLQAINESIECLWQTVFIDKEWKEEEVQPESKQ